MKAILEWSKTKVHWNVNARAVNLFTGQTGFSADHPVVSWLEKNIMKVFDLSHQNVLIL